MGCVYCVTNRVNGKKYIGKTIGRMEYRKKDHERDASEGKRFVFHKALRKYGFDSFNWEILFVSNNDDVLCRVEIDQIQELSTRIPNGYNMTEGGQIGNGKPMLGKKHTEESRILMSNRGKQRFKAMPKEEVIEWVRIMNKGREGLPGPRLGVVVSQETRNRMSESARKRKLHSIETRYKIGLGNRGKKRKFTKKWKENMSKSAKEVQNRPEVRKKKSEALKGKPWTEARRRAQRRRQEEIEE